MLAFFFSFSPQIFYRQPRNAFGLQMFRCLNSAAQFKENKELMSTCIRQTAASHPNIGSPICPNDCGVGFFVEICFSFREIIFLVLPLKYANFHHEYYPSCVTSCNEFT